jgi:hypothetical protein
MSLLRCGKIDDHAKERGSARAARRSGLVISVISKVRYPEPNCCLHNAKPFQIMDAKTHQKTTAPCIPHPHPPISALSLAYTNSTSTSQTAPFITHSSAENMPAPPPPPINRKSSEMKKQCL